MTKDDYDTGSISYVHRPLLLLAWVGRGWLKTRGDEKHVAPELTTQGGKEAYHMCDTEGCSL